MGSSSNMADEKDYEAVIAAIDACIEYSENACQAMVGSVDDCMDVCSEGEVVDEVVLLASKNLMEVIKKLVNEEDGEITKLKRLRDELDGIREEIIRRKEEARSRIDDAMGRGGAQ